MFNKIKTYTFEQVKIERDMCDLLNKKMNIQNVEDFMDCLNKLSKNTILAIDKGVEHVKRNKKTYKKLVLYIAVCMSPLFIEVGFNLFKYIMCLLAYIGSNSQYKHIVYQELISTLTFMFRWILIFLISKDVISNVWNRIIKNLKSNK